MLLEIFLLLCLLLAGFGIGQYLFAGWGALNGGRLVVMTFIGTMLLTYVYIFLAAMGHAHDLLVAALVAVLGVLALWRRRPRVELTWQPVLLCAAILVLLPMAIQGIMMGRGDYPRVFFNVDSAYFLQFVHSFLNAGEYPPPHLDNYLLPTHGYHYGVMAFAALTAGFTGMAPHTAFLLFVPVFGILAFVAALNELLKTLDVQSPRQRAIVMESKVGNERRGKPRIAVSLSIR